MASHHQKQKQEEGNMTTRSSDGMKLKMLRHRCYELHHQYIKKGMFDEAWYVLRLLRKSNVKLYLDDASWTVQCDLEEIGCTMRYSKNGYTATAYLVA